MQKMLIDKQDSTGAKGNSNQVKGPCYFCKKMGHVKRECWKLKGRSRNGQGDQFVGKNLERDSQGSNIQCLCICLTHTCLPQ